MGIRKKMENMNRLILIRGLPGSGKSSLARTILNSVRMEADNYWYRNGEYNFDATKLHIAHKCCQEECERALAYWSIMSSTEARDKKIVVSNTFTTKKELKPYFKIAKRFGIIPTVIVCQNNFGNIHNVPEETLIKMKNRWEDDISELFEGMV